MKGVAKWLVYLFAAYNFIVGLFAIFMPNMLSSLYAVTSLSADAILPSRWLGALAAAVGYGAFVLIKTPNKGISQILLLGAFATMIASVLAVLNGDATIGNVGLDFVLQLAFVVGVFIAGKDYGL